jgi:hypothetical protein
MSSKSSSLTTTIVIALVAVVIIVGAVVYMNGNKSSASNNSTGTGQIAGATKSKTANPTITLNKTYSAKALDNLAKEAKTNIQMNIKTAEKAQEILIKGTPATAQNGSAFLVFQIELKNTSNERLIIAPLDLLRLMVDDQKRAAEIYTEELSRIKGSVVVEPDSTKVTRVGFVLTPDIANKPFKLQVGEINSPDKKIIDVKF